MRVVRGCSALAAVSAQHAAWVAREQKLEPVLLEKREPGCGWCSCHSAQHDMGGSLFCLWVDRGCSASLPFQPSMARHGGDLPCMWVDQGCSA